MEIHSMKQLRNEHRKAVEAGAKVSLKEFAGQHNALSVIKASHEEASKARSEATRDRTRASTTSARTGGKKGAK